MKSSALNNERTIDALANRLLKDSRSTVSPQELAASLLRLNPHLHRINALEEGTPILLPPELATNGDEPQSGASAPLIEEAARALHALRAQLDRGGAEVRQEIEEAQAWLKGEPGKQVLREVPELKEEFRKTATAASDLGKKQAAHLVAQVKLLQKLQDELEIFPTPGLPPAARTRRAINTEKRNPGRRSTSRTG